ncbi:MAG: hypothetical protein GC150_05320 [Rhizobiales bacterium]|nr:hypothetical protein [Hyphomicrobiales bacterium]
MSKPITTLALAAFVAAGGALATVATAEARPRHDLRPDLVIQSVELYSTDRCNALSPAIVGDVVIKNRGHTRSKALWISPILRVQDLADAGFKDAEVRIKALDPGESISIRVNIGTLRSKVDYDGSRRLRVIADPRNRIEEANELNNALTVRVRTRCT